MILPWSPPARPPRSPARHRSRCRPARASGRAQTRAGRGWGSFGRVSISRAEPDLSAESTGGWCQMNQASILKLLLFFRSMFTKCLTKHRCGYRLLAEASKRYPPPVINLALPGLFRPRQRLCSADLRVGKLGHRVRGRPRASGCGTCAPCTRSL